MQSAIIAPSVLSADFGQLAEEVRSVEKAGADWIHLDVMDGHFVPNLTFGPPVISAIRTATKLPFDIHLMIERPELSIQQYVDAGADLVTVHAESTVHLHRTLGQIKEAGTLAGVAINPGTPVSAIEHVLQLADLVLLMTVNPGFGGQSFIREVLPKVQAVRALLDAMGSQARIQVDGGVTAATIAEVSAAGADTFVAGSAVFGAADYKASIAALRDAL